MTVARDGDRVQLLGLFILSFLCILVQMPLVTELKVGLIESR
jgi:hypothetical protein